MTPEFHTATYDALKPILDILTTLPDPMPMTDFHWVIERLGWTPQAPRFGHTNLPVNMTVYMVSDNDSAAPSRTFSWIRLGVSDSFLDEVPADKRTAIQTTFPAMVNLVSKCLGNAPKRERPWGTPGWSWDLSNGKQVNLVQDGHII